MTGVTGMTDMTGMTGSRGQGAVVCKSQAQVVRAQSCANHRLKWSGRSRVQITGSSGQGAVVCKSQAQVVRAQSCANHRLKWSGCNRVQITGSSGQGAIVCKSCATHRALSKSNISCDTWYEGTAQLPSLTELKSHLFLALFYWMTLSTNEGGKETRVLGKNP